MGAHFNFTLTPRPYGTNLLCFVLHCFSESINIIRAERSTAEGFAERSDFKIFRACTDHKMAFFGRKNHPLRQKFRANWKIVNILD